jgi:hypothetical protein
MITTKHTKYTKVGEGLSIFWPTEHTDYTEKISGPEPWMDSVKRGRTRSLGGLAHASLSNAARPAVGPYLRSEEWQYPVGLGLR